MKSMRIIVEVTAPDVDTLVAAVQELNGVNPATEVEYNVLERDEIQEVDNG